MLLINLAVSLGSWSIILGATGWQVYGIESSENERTDSGTSEQRTYIPYPFSIKGALVQKLARYDQESALHGTVRSSPVIIEAPPQSSVARQKRLLRVEVEIPEKTENVTTELREILSKITRMESTLKTIETDSTHARKIWDQLPNILDTTADLEMDNSIPDGSTGGSAVDDATLPTDCYDVSRSGEIKSGVYKIRPATPNAAAFDVYCQMDTHGGGWTVFQHRRDGLINFYQNWNTYKTGFGILDGEFWLGLEHIYQLTKSKHYELLVELEDWEYNTAFARYNRFALGSEEEKYSISRLGRYSGTAGDAMTLHAGRNFSTWDQSNGGGVCATAYTGAWWFENCFHSHLNGPYLVGSLENYPVDAPGIDWFFWRRRKYSLKETRMSLRPLP